MEMKYYFTYKCRLCNTEIRYGNPVKIKTDELPRLLGKIVELQELPGNAPFYLPHSCSSKKLGLAVFSGFASEV